jgi:hypothetical protein
VLDAARQVFVLADGDDFAFGYPDSHTMTARPWIVYAVLSGLSGTDIWRVSVTGDGQARVGLETTPWPVKTPEVYELFWDRMDYLR